ncbi:MAG: polysaccharide biosynthesis/export family protein [Pseudomonadota bacterium]|nr:polysaccharide biosynthesis/export family protein [Pseudomonadota bacterium]
MLLSKTSWLQFAVLLFGWGLMDSNAQAAERALGLYRLTAGDVISIAHSGLDDAIEARVDIDGHVRLVDFGVIAVRGLTLSAAETAIADAIESAGYFVEPRVDIALIDYAPIVVAGDVAEPGRIDFIPGMSIETAIAIAGGTRTFGRLQSEMSHLRSGLEGTARQRQFDIVSQKVEIARLKATLAESLTLGLSKETSKAIDGLPEMAELAKDTQRLLNADLRRADVLIANWDQEISAIETQRAIYADRLKVREEVAAFARSELAIAKDLQEKGLQTSARLLSVELREANARSDVLELRTAQVVAATAQAQAERERENFLTQRETRLLKELNAAKEQLAKDVVDLARINEQLAHLDDPILSASFSDPTFDIVLRLNRQSRELKEASLATAVMPGDIVFIELQPIASE